MKRLIDKNFMPMAIVLRDFKNEVAAAPHKTLTVCVEREKGYNYSYKLDIFKDNDEKNYAVAERIVKTLIWLVGGYKVYVAGDSYIAKRLKEDYRKGGAREFDADFMAGVYESPFEIIECAEKDIPPLKESSFNIGGHFEGCRIGFDAGGSDRKVSAVKDGEVLYSEEVLWLPKVNEDPSYHYNEIYTAFKTAADKLPKVDAIGVSSAGIYVDNKIMAASLFVKVPKDKFDKQVKNMYIDIASKFGDVPLFVANDGDVTALAGAMELNDNKVLGIAMGTSEAAGYINKDGGINGWLNELGFVPICFNRECVDDWSGDGGVGSRYLCQEGVIHLAELLGHKFTEDTPAKKLKKVQEMMESGDERIKDIYLNMGEYLGYAIAYYTEFYDIKHILLLGRVTSGEGGNILMDEAKRIVREEFGLDINITMPDESNRRLGQSVVAASLPELN